MMQRLILVLFAILTLLLFGCASTLPQQRVTPPWNRIQSTNNDIPIGSQISIEVDCQTNPLIGSEVLTESGIRDVAKSLLERRGYTVAENSNQYKMKILYKADTEIKKISSSSASASSNDYLFGSNNSNFGLGVLLAAALLASGTTASTTTISTTTVDVSAFVHTFAVEIYNLRNEIEWKTDIKWDSYNLNVLDQTLTALQTVFSTLPSDYRVMPNIPKLKEFRFHDYFKQKVEGYYYHSPAVPYRIRFASSGAPDILIDYGIGNRSASLAYLDLLQTAEYALPGLDARKWKNPMNPNIWKKIVLGGRYTLGKQKEPVNVLISLKSDMFGYMVDKCNVVSDSAYQEYLTSLALWRETLREYYDFFE